MKALITLSLTIQFLFALPATSQNLESIGKEKLLTLNGGLSLNQLFYAGAESRRDPYKYYASGNLNIGLYGWNVPLSFSFSNKNFSYQQPFNQFGLHPFWKWITAHMGYASMSFSPYTLNGHIFKGVGVDLSPGEKLSISFMYGRLLKAVEPDTIHENAATPSFKQMGYGLKAHYGDPKQFVELILFHARDDSASIAYVPEQTGILPQENLVVSVGAGVTIVQKILIKSELASSALSRDIRADAETKDSFLNFIFTPRVSTAYYKAFKSSVAYQGQGYTAGLAYERVDPGYRTLGAYYFNNDLENITVNGAVALAGGKVNLSTNIGAQRDNLNNTKVSTMRRFVSSVNVGFVPREQFSISANYSNFRSFVNIRSQFTNINQLTPYDNLDTLNFTQITQNLNVVANYIFGSDSKRQSLSFNSSVMKSADRQGGIDQNTGSIFYNSSCAYSLNLVSQGLTFAGAFNFTRNNSHSSSSSTGGPTFSLTKSMLDKKLRTSAAVSFNNTFTENHTVNSVASLRGNASYTARQKHSFSLSVVSLSRKMNQEIQSKRIAEFTATVSYSYSF